MQSADPEDTIAAIATPSGAGGIGIIRISGARAFSVLKTLFRPKSASCSFLSHRLYYGHIHHPRDGKILDEVMAVIMRAPQSYTREDVAEIHCHGSSRILQDILELMVSQEGVRLAAPGEFTKRAFLNGRIDLTQAEAVIDILSAKTRKGIDLAQAQLSGSLYQRLDTVRQSLVSMRAVVEVAIDFPDEDVDIVNTQSLAAQVESQVIQPLEKLLANVSQARLFREGISLVIAGRPNVGKSSLLNALLQEDRALVASIPGTTRDYIEEVLDIEGVPVRLFDTAGIRLGADTLEELGIQKAKDLINLADLVLFLVDASMPITEEDRLLFADVADKPVILVFNKVDLCDAGQCVSDLCIEADIIDKVQVSARQQYGIDDLKSAIVREIFSGQSQWEEEGCAPNLRHQDALQRAVAAARQIVTTLRFGVSNDLLAVDLQDCLNALGDIVGETTPDDVLDLVFERFCLGK
ncbi:MAG: tRNA uridine-5-carboxymethylaminomethyl(34) synthesis GTPase MnmE [Deltaproteobacteria bacterium]|nr:MAG: tRNA uridine-5-carboxymethylaminomethyl(34) synthesis GTPase MnmE [Deltaproteobacteria bacterium]